MDGGQIVEKGDHVELLARGGAYATLYNAQFAGELSPRWRNSSSTARGR